MRRAQGHLYKINSPNSRNWLELQSNGKKENAITYVAIGLESGSGTVYGVRGERLPIKAYWFNDTTIVIETSKEYEVFIRYHKVTTKNAVYHIRYIES